MTPPLSVGSHVEITGPAFGNIDVCIGESGEISEISERGNFRISGLWYPASSLRLVEELKIGDWVEVILNDTPYTGRIGKVSDVGEEWIALYNMGAWRRSSLRKRTPEEIQQHTGTIGYQAQKCNAELEKAKEAMREILAPLVDERLSAIEKRQDRQTEVTDHLYGIVRKIQKRLGDVEALAENAGAIEKRLTSIEKRQREQHERMDRFMQDYREHKDFDFDMHDRIKVLEGERPEVCEGKPDRVICPNARFSPRSKCMFCGNGTDLCHDKLVRSACEYKVLDSMKEA